MLLSRRRIRRALLKRNLRRRLPRRIRSSLYIRRPRNGGRIVKMRFAYTAIHTPKVGETRRYVQLGLRPQS